jgi:hypothetical protein
VARDGSHIEYGDIDPEQDYYDPEGAPLFGDDDDPDEEDYEGYTGNAGGWHDMMKGGGRGG